MTRNPKKQQEQLKQQSFVHNCQHSTDGPREMSGA